MRLSLETLTSITKTGLSILVELIDLVSSAIIFPSQTTLLRWLTFILAYQAGVLKVLLFSISFFLLMLVFILQWLSFHWEILIMLSPQFPLTFHYIYNEMPRFIALLLAILVLIETVYLIIFEIFHEKISLNSVLMLLLVNFVSEVILKLMYISFI